MSADEYVLASIGLLTLCSLLTRSAYFVFGDRFPLSEEVRQALRYAPVAALTGIIVPGLAPWEQGLSAFYDTPMLAAVIAVLCYVVTRSALWVMVGGMVALWVLRWLLA